MDITRAFDAREPAVVTFSGTLPAGQWLLCATHGAVYKPDTGECAGGPCRGGLVKIALSEQDGVVHWHTDWNLKPLVV